MLIFQKKKLVQLLKQVTGWKRPSRRCDPLRIMEVVNRARFSLEKNKKISIILLNLYNLKQLMRED